MRSTLRRPMPALQIGYHDHCFDGVASAAAFLRFYRDKVKPGLTDVGLRGLAHRAGQLFDPDVFAGEENAVVDFRFSPDPRLTWWFDHHQSAFESASDEAVFHADRSGRKFWDPQAKSCTRFLARSEEHTSELQSRLHLVCRLLLEKKKKIASSGARIKTDTVPGSFERSVHTRIL